MRRVRYQTPTPAKVDEALRMLEQGLTQAAIARKLHLNNNQVSKIRKGWRPQGHSMNLKSYEVDAKTGCHVWQGCIDVLGFGRYWYAGKSRPVHRVVWCLHKRLDIVHMERHHIVIQVCENRLCINPAHMRQRSAWHGAKLNEERVRAIRKAHTAGATIAELMKEWGLSHPSMWSVVTGRSYKWVK